MAIAAAPAGIPVATVGAGARARVNGLDALRASLVLLVVLHHTALTYGAIGGWFYRELAPSASTASLLLTLFCTVNQAYFMGLFFLLAGYFTPGAFERRGGAVPFAADRLLRLGLPLLVFGYVIGPATIALVRTTAHIRFVDALVWRWRHGVFEPGPLWFCIALLIFTTVWLAWRASRGKDAPAQFVAFPSDRALLLAALATGIVAFLLRLVWPVGVTVGSLQLGYFASYVVLFAAGCLGAKARWLENLPVEQVRRWRRIAWVTLPVLPVAALAARLLPLLEGDARGGLNAQALIYAFWEPFVAWGVIMALIVFFQKRVNANTVFWRMLSRRAYMIFIIHPPVVVGVALAWRNVPAPALLKFALTGSVACALCVLLAGALLSIPGVKRVV